MHRSTRTAICPPWRIHFRSLIVVVLATVYFAVSLGGAGSWSSALAQKPDVKSASDNKGKSGAKNKGVKRAGKNGTRQGKGRRGRRGPATVFVDKVTEGIAVDTVQIYGRVIAQQTGVIAARTRGAVGTIEARVGDRVRKGDILATLVSDMLESERALKWSELK